MAGLKADPYAKKIRLLFGGAEHGDLFQILLLTQYGVSEISLISTPLVLHVCRDSPGHKPSINLPISTGYSA